MNPTLPLILDDRWIIVVFQNLVLKQDWVFSVESLINIENKYKGSIIESVREIVPDSDFDMEPRRINDFLKNRLRLIVKELIDEYSKLPGGGFRLCMRNTSTGEYELYFFLLARMVKEGLLGNFESAKSLLLHKDTCHCYPADVHALKVGRLFV